MDRKLLCSLLLVILVLATGPVFADSSTENTSTKYPIVLVHGFLGSGMVNDTETWGKIPNALREQGNQVFVAQVAPNNSSEQRGEQLLAIVENLIAIYGFEKVNLVGHSQGGQTIRYVAAVSPNIVASVTTVASPHKGMPFAELLNTFAEYDPVMKTVIEMAGYLFGSLVDYISGGNFDHDSMASLKELTNKGSLQFNQRYPLGVPESSCGEGDSVSSTGIYYFSWGGAALVTNWRDAADFVLLFMSILFEGEKSDGAIGVCSSHFGTVIRDNYWLNHYDLVDGKGGITPIWGPDPVNLYVLHANRLQQLGL